MIYPIEFGSQNKKSDAVPTKQNSKKYHDPLNQKWMVALSYSNEIGAAIYEIAPKLSQILWIPPLMYLGADIYDKYKNDKNHYNPSRTRAVEQAIYQGLSSFIFPAAAIIAGQNLTSPIAKLLNKGLSVNAKKDTLLHMSNAVDQCVGEMFDDREKFKQFFCNSLENKIRACKNEKQSDSWWKKFFKNLSGKYALANCKKAKIMDYANENIDRLIKIKEALQSKKKPAEISYSSYRKYMREYPVLKETYGEIFANNALRYSLKTYINQLQFGNKLLKTIGGLIAMIISIKPIDAFVKKVVMPNYIDPGIERFNKALLDSSNLKKHIKGDNTKAPTDAAHSI